MKTRAVLLFTGAVVFVCCVTAPSSFACTQPGTVTITFTWGPNHIVGLLNNNVPDSPVNTAYGNWNGLLAAYYCSPVIQPGGTSIIMNFSHLAAPSPCPSGSTCFTRGITDFTQASFDAESPTRLSYVPITINSDMTATAAITEVVAHELGHTFGLVDCNYPSCAPGSSVMEAKASKDIYGNNVTGVNSIVGQPGPTPCDMNAVLSVASDYNCSPPPPPPPPPPDPCCACRYKGEGKQQQNDFEVLKARSPCCTCDCPIIIDTSGNGFDLTSVANGVRFDMSGTASPVQTSWTAPGAQDAFLCLPDSNGACDDGKDLFGNFTPQPPSQTPNGYNALAVYDLPANGGNGDGIIDSKDAIFSQLRLWIDRNHDGISQPDEIYTLPALGVYSISLNYKEDRKVDQYGNLFRYRAQVNVGDPTSTGRMAYDVFFITTPTTITKNTPRSLTPADGQKCPAPAKGGMPVNER